MGLKLLLIILLLLFTILLGSTQAFFSADVRTDAVRYKAVDIVSGDAALYTTGVVLSFYCC